MIHKGARSTSPSPSGFPAQNRSPCVGARLEARLSSCALAQRDSGRKDHRAANFGGFSCRHLPAVSGGCVARGRPCRMERASMPANMVSARSAGWLTTSNSSTRPAARILQMRRPGTEKGCSRLNASYFFGGFMKIGRNASSGRFMTVKAAKANKKGAIVQNIKRTSPKKSK